MGLGREAPHVAYPVPMIFAASMRPIPEISVRLVPEASTSASICLFRFAIFRSSVRILSAGSLRPIDGGGGPRRLAAVCCARCSQLGGSRAFQVLRRPRGPSRSP